MNNKNYTRNFTPAISSTELTSKIRRNSAQLDPDCRSQQCNNTARLLLVKASPVHCGR